MDKILLTDEELISITDETCLRHNKTWNDIEKLDECNLIIDLYESAAKAQHIKTAKAIFDELRKVRQVRLTDKYLPEIFFDAPKFNRIEQSFFGG